MRRIYKCRSCDKYTMKEICECGEKTFSVKPLKYSPGDKLDNYRRKAKYSEYVSRGMLQ